MANFLAHVRWAMRQKFKNLNKSHLSSSCKGFFFLLNDLLCSTGPSASRVFMLLSVSKSWYSFSDWIFLSISICQKLQLSSFVFCAMAKLWGYAPLNSSLQTHWILCCKIINIYKVFYFLFCDWACSIALYLFTFKVTISNFKIRTFP